MLLHPWPCRDKHPSTASCTSGCVQRLLRARCIPDARILSARALAKELGVARGTIEVAYELLAAEGYLLACGQAGTVVNPALQPSVCAPHASAPASQVNALPGAATAAVDASALSTPRPPRDTLWRPPQLLPFQMGVPALDAFPRKI